MRTHALTLFDISVAPTFAITALLTAVLGGGLPDMICAGMQDGSSIRRRG